MTINLMNMTDKKRPRKYYKSDIAGHAAEIMRIVNENIPDNYERQNARVKLDEFLLWLGVAIVKKGD